MRSLVYALGLAIVAGSIQVSLGAVTAVPEIDGGTVVSGLGLVSGAVLVLRARFRR